MTLKSARAKALNIVEYEGDQLEIDFSEIGFDPDRPQLSLCPKCVSDLTLPRVPRRECQI